MDLAGWAAWLEASGVARTLRDGLWLYPLVNLAHVLGIALLFGAVTLLDLRLMGAWRAVPLAALARPAIPLAAAGFVLAATSGAGLLSVKAVEYAQNPFLYAKFAAVGLAGVNAAALHASSAWRSGSAGALPRRLAVAGGTSLLCWLGAVAAGRMIAYW